MIKSDNHWAAYSLVPSYINSRSSLDLEIMQRSKELMDVWHLEPCLVCSHCSEVVIVFDVMVRFVHGWKDLLFVRLCSNMLWLLLFCSKLCLMLTSHARDEEKGLWWLGEIHTGF